MAAKIVLIEDDQMLVEMYSLMFKAEAFTVLIADNGESGLALVKKELPDLVLLDVMMPKMDGFEVLAELKKDAKTKDIPVLLLTNLSQQGDLEKGKNLGAADYVVKASMTPSGVIERIKKYLK